MKKILVATDFSPVADNAIKYAIEITPRFKSEIYLYHIYPLDRFNYEWDFPMDKQPYTIKVGHKMKGTKLKFVEKITEKGLSIQTMVEEDSIFFPVQNKGNGSWD